MLVPYSTTALTRITITPQSAPVTRVESYCHKIAALVGKELLVCSGTLQKFNINCISLSNHKVRKTCNIRMKQLG